MSRTNWGSVLVDISIIAMAIIVSILQNNFNYLWLLALTLITGNYNID